MAARLTNRLSQQHRDSIQTSMLINRLQDHIVGKVDMSSSQVRAAQILLNKTIPDLKAIEHSTDPDNPLITRIENVIVDAKS